LYYSIFILTFVLFLELEKTQKSIIKKKKKSDKDDESDDDNVTEANISHQKVLDWPAGNKTDSEHKVPPKKHRKGFQKKQNAQL